MRPGSQRARLSNGGGGTQIHVIEFLGVPGSGKTTLWRKTRLILDASGVTAYDPIEATRIGTTRGGEDVIARVLALTIGRFSDKLWKKIYSRSSDRISAMAHTIADHPDRFATFVAAAKTHNHEAGPEVVASAMVDLVVSRSLAERHLRDDEWLVVDEGFCSRVTSLFAIGWSRKADKPVLEAYIDAIPKPDLVVRIETPLELCAERLDHRGWTKRIRHLSRPELIRFLENAQECISLTERMLKERGVRVVTIAGDAGLDERTRELAAVLREVVTLSA